MKTLRSLLSEGALVVAPGALDPLTARVIEKVGFPVVYLGGNAMGSHLAVGQPFLTLTEVVECVYRTVRAIDVPLIVDADGGFGDAAHVHRTVEEFVRAGASAIHIDDQVFPKRAHYHVGKVSLTPLPQMLDKLRVARAAAGSSEMMIIARTDALRATGSIAETLARSEAYKDAGVDALMVLDLGPEDAHVFRTALPGLPLVWIGGVTEPLPTVGELQAAGFAIALYPMNTAAAVASAVRTLWTRLRDDGRLPQSGEFLAQARRELVELSGIERYIEIERHTTERSS